MQIQGFWKDCFIYLLMCIAFLCWCFYFKVLGRRKRLKYPPGPWGLPIVGNLPQLGSSPHVTLTRLSRLYGDVFSLKLGSWNVVVLNSDRAVREALLKRSRQFSQRPLLFTFTLGAVRDFSIAFGEYNPMHAQRKRCALKAIHQVMFENLERLNQAVADGFQDLKRSLSKNLENAFDPSTHLKMCVVKIMFDLTFGNDASNEQLSEELHKIVVGSSEFTESSAASALVDFLPWAKCFFRKQVSVVESSIQELIHFVRMVYCVRKSGYKGNSCIAATYCRLLNQARGSFNFKQQNSPFSATLESFVVSDEETVKTIAADIFGAGLETVSNALCWAVAYLVNNTALQRDLQRELDRIVGRGQRLPTIQDRPNMPLMHATVLEVLRNATVLPLALPHFTTEGTSLGGYEVPEGTLIIVNLWAVNHDPRVFTNNPTSFEPRRFLDEHGNVREEKCTRYMPFSTGSRRCLGSTLAKAEIFLLLACLLQHFEFSRVTMDAVDTEGLFGMTLKPKPFVVNARLRENKKD